MQEPYTMSKFLDITLQYLSYDTKAQSNDPADADKMKLRIQESTINQVFRLQQAIANATVDQVVALPDANTTYLIIASDQSISIKLNGSSTATPLNVPTPGTKTPLMFLRGNITGLTISNASGAIANADILLIK